MFHRFREFGAAGMNDRRRVLSQRSRATHGGQERQTLIRADFGNHLSSGPTVTRFPARRRIKIQKTKKAMRLMVSHNFWVTYSKKNSASRWKD
jgi:hypothetical protein